jgi:HK97 gp10 family phage protein
LSTTVRVEGMPALRRALLTITQEGRRTVQREVMRSALKVQAGAKVRCPVDTGRLRNSIAVEIQDEGLSALVGTNVEYAPFVEFGTSRQRPQPYLFPAYEEEHPQFVERLRRELGSAFVRAGKP